MNILFVCAEYPPMPSGGIGSVVKIVAEGLVKRGHKVVVAGYYSHEPALDGHVVNNGVHIYNYSLGLRSSMFMRYLYQAINIMHLAGPWTQHELDYFENKLSLLIEEHSIDVMEMTDYYDFDYCRTLLRFHKFNIPVVMRFHGSAYYLYANVGHGNNKVKLNDLAHFARANCQSFVSSYIRGFVWQMGSKLCDDNEVVIHNMVEGSFLNNDILQTDDKTILYFGKLTKTKGAFATIQAFCIFHETHPDWILVMAGPAYTDAILEGVPAKVKQNISFPGLCNREQIKQYIDASSFICIPSYYETFSMALLEAMARSRAVIFTERTSGPEIIENGKTGLLVDPENIQMISNSMSLLADDVNLRNEIAANAFHKIETSLTESRILDRLEYLYESL